MYTTSNARDLCNLQTDKNSRWFSSQNTVYIFTSALGQQESLLLHSRLLYRPLSDHHFSSKSTSMIWDFGGFLELPLLLLLLPSLEKKSPCGCHTMFPHPSHLMTWLLYPRNCLLHAGHSPCVPPNVRYNRALNKNLVQET